MKFNPYIFFIAVAISLSSCVSMKHRHAEYRDEAVAEKAIKEIKDGVLIARFYSQQKTLDEIDRLLELGNTGHRSDLERKKSEITNDRKEYLAKIHAAFKEKYDFSEIYFIKDSDMRRFNDGDRVDVFINEKGEFDNSISIDTDDYYFISVGNHLDQVHILDRKGKRLPAPFPSKVYASWIIPAWLRLGYPKGKNFPKVVAEVNKMLKWYSDKVTSN